MPEKVNFIYNTINVLFIYRLSVRHHTFLSNSKLPLWKVIAFCHLWVEKCTLNFIMKQIGVSRQTASDWACFCRHVIFDEFINGTSKIGGPGKM